MEWLSRTHLLMGDEKLNCLKNAHVLVVGIGGVGGYACEQIARAGVGAITIVDKDTVSESNINRQLIALHSTIHKDKVEVMADRLRNINPNIKLTIIKEFLRDEMTDQVLETPFDYVVDAIDTMTPKINLIAKTLKKGYPLVSSFGAGGRMDPSMIKVAPVEKSHGDKLGFHVRKRLHRMGIHTGFQVVFSDEQVPENAWYVGEGEQNKKAVVGTVSYMPPVFGCMLASVVIRDLVKHEIKSN
ncbi:MAG: tRNA threonylcarbamoyladenosine dehydratase [Bacteroidales bacterium]|nr:tRNA threonylcarbamoyladenosine dehydratase [Bacteroidales bacterium]